MTMRSLAGRILALALSAGCLPFFLSARARRAHPQQRLEQDAPSVRVGQTHQDQIHAAPSAQIARGRYLVEQVAMCGDCHTPRDENSNLDESRWLEGARIWIKPVHTMYNWAEWAPRLAGLPSFTDQQAETVLEKGIGPNGAPIRPPMHIYHMSPADADAIIAYLRSLNPSHNASNAP